MMGNGLRQATDEMLRDDERERGRAGLIAGVQAVLLFTLVCWVFNDEFGKIVSVALAMPDWAHVTVTPVLVGLMVYGRRDALRCALGYGSLWGAVLLGLAILLYALATWPFYFGYIRKLQFVTAAAGIVLAVGGWRVLLRCVPVLLLLAMAIPLGWNTYATLVIRPESLTLEVVARLLDALPQVVADLRGPDIMAVYGGAAYDIALGDPHRGFTMPMTYLSIVVFVILVRVRPWWQLVVLAFAAPVVVVLANAFRLLVHGMVTIYVASSPLDATPRVAAALTSLVLAYLVAAAAVRVLDALFVEDASGQEDASGEEDAHGAEEESAHG